MRNKNEFDKYRTENSNQCPRFIKDSFTPIDPTRPITVRECRKDEASYRLYIENGQIDSAGLKTLHNSLRNTKYFLDFSANNGLITIEFGRYQELPKAFSFSEITQLLENNRDRGLFLGLGSFGEMFCSMDKFQHAILFGATGFGKSSFLRSLVSNILAFHDDCVCSFIDLKGIDFKGLEGLPGISLVGSTYPEAVSILDLILLEITLRKILFQQWQNPPRSLSEYNSWAPAAHLPELPRHILVIDEFRMLRESDCGYINENAMSRLEYILRVGRAYGIHLILSSQRDIDFTSNIVTNCSNCFFTFHGSNGGHAFYGELIDEAYRNKGLRAIPGMIAWINNDPDSKQKVYVQQTPYCNDFDMYAAASVLRSPKAKVWENYGFIPCSFSADVVNARCLGRAILAGVDLQDCNDEALMRFKESDKFLRLNTQDRIHQMVHKPENPAPADKKTEKTEPSLPERLRWESII